jgi:Ca2+-binding EF-hand superfamily protein
MDRMWSIAIFRFLDFNQDGCIDATDLFSIYKYADKLTNKIQEQIKQLQQRKGRL